ncbi:Mrp/NBP35 family ATP-binding protein [Alphaproteobacteria bacterium]|nr:Mrp/NBP35 family ATP-binding protein [Alphaproteobacteria bacterium]
MKDKIISTFSNDLKELIENIIIQNQKIFVTLKAKSPEDAKKLEKFKVECVEKISNFKNFNEINVTFTLIKKKFSKIIAISSCKGGVGKSTVSVNIAHSLKSMGYKVGILDCDIYGPSIPKLLNISQKPDVDENKKILPIIHNGIEVISIGLMINEDKPIIWRGPMIQSALMQLINEVKWSQLDFLVLDLPPGTGDVHLTIAQKLKIDHAVVVTTSEEIAIADTRKGINMLLKFNIPISGIIENMSYLICKDGTKDFLFGENKAEELAKEFNTNFLGKIPFYRNFFKTISQEDSTHSNQTQIINSITKKIVNLSN